MAGRRRPPSNLHKPPVLRFLLPVPSPTFAAMPSSSPPCSLLLLALGIGVLLLPSASASASNRTATVHEVLPRYGLPPGLFPDAVASYSLGGDGRFVVELDRPSCYVQFGPFLVYYERRITGALVMGSIRDLGGIQVQRRFLWLDVGEIKVDLPPTDSIYFQVGWITKRLSVEDFRTLHSCGGSASYKDRIFGIFPEPLYDIDELITGDMHIAL